MVTVRRVDVSNALVRAAITALHAECFSARRDNPYTPPQAGQWWVVFDGKKDIGFAGIVPSSLPRAGYLCRAGVLPAYRGRGLQCRLIRLRLRYAREQGWDYVVTDTHLNPPSANSLIKCGFRVFQPEHMWAFSDSIYWRKQLT